MEFFLKHYTFRDLVSEKFAGDREKKKKSKSRFVREGSKSHADRTDRHWIPLHTYDAFAKKNIILNFSTKKIKKLEIWLKELQN